MAEASPTIDRPDVRPDTGGPDCDAEWPCHERLAQRDTYRQIRDLLHSALWRWDDKIEADGTEWARWKSPLGWLLDWTYGSGGLRVRIRARGGEVQAETDYASVGWVAQRPEV